MAHCNEMTYENHKAAVHPSMLEETLESSPPPEGCVGPQSQAAAPFAITIS